MFHCYSAGQFETFCIFAEIISCPVFLPCYDMIDSVTYSLIKVRFSLFFIVNIHKLKAYTNFSTYHNLKNIHPKMRDGAILNLRSLTVGFSLLYFLITVEALCKPKEVAIGFVQSLGSRYPGVLTNNCDILTMSRGSTICEPKWNEILGSVSCYPDSRPMTVYTLDNYFDDCYRIDQAANDCDLPTLTRIYNVEPVWCCVPERQNDESSKN